MCGSKPSVDTTAQDQMREDSRLAREREEARQAEIDSGVEQIDGIFSGFDQGFFDNYRNEILGVQTPQLQDQYSNAQDELTFALARAGTLNSTAAAQRRGDLSRDYATQTAAVLADANNATDRFRSTIDAEKGDLITMLNATADANRASNEALSRSQNLFNKVPDYNPIGEIFGGFAQGVGGAIQGAQNRAAWDYYQSGGSRGRSSARTVG
ncbi:MAG: hypothetical protein AAGK37_19195 [Pseudomonadota bacterium]